MRLKPLAAALTAIALTGCATAPRSAQEALELYYDTIPDSQLPVAPAGKPLPPATATLSRILVGSCNDEEKPDATLATIADAGADLFLMVGDNVYGDMNGRSFVSNQADLNELRESYADLAANPDFQRLRANVPMMAVWDDHDFGANDGGSNFPFKPLAERIFENFWGATAEVRARPGIYESRSFGPAGERVQIILLDTRYFRSPLTPTDAYGTPGKERYIPATGGDQDMLGAPQWAWLKGELEKPADIRLIVSSVQVVATEHGWESWNKLPAELGRFYALVRETGAKGVIFASGDRHTAFLYRAEGVLPYPAYEITASALNQSFATESAESDKAMIGSGYAPNNYGEIRLDWQARTVTLDIRSQTGEVVRTVSFPMSEIGVE